MSIIRRREERAGLEIEQVRQALGVVAVAEPAVFWVYMDQHRQWHVRREGAPGQQAFVSRDAARTFVEVVAARCRSHRLFRWAIRPTARQTLHARPQCVADEATSIDTD
jgi:hypothetical protein